MRKLRIITGLLTWVTVAVVLYCWLDAVALSPHEESRRLAADLWQYTTDEPPTVALELEQPAAVAVGDPIFVIEGPGSVRQVGEIRRVSVSELDVPARRAVVTEAVAMFYPTAPEFNSDTQLTYYATPGSMSWVVETMLPAEKKQLITQEIAATYQAHHAEILAELKPVVVAGFYDAMRVVEQDLGTAIRSRRGELQKLGSRYQDEVVEEEIVPLVRAEIWPIVRKHAEPLANEMGSEMWQRASLWRFGWRYAYDKLPLTEQNLTRQEWNRFLNKDAIPVVEKHSSDMVAIQQRILADVARNPEVRSAVRRNLSRVIDDPEFRDIVWQIVREVLIDNPRLRETLDEHWQSVEARRAIQLAADRIEPCVRRIGDLLFGTQEEGITPEFARVLRNQILGKDRRWFVMETVPRDGQSSESPTGPIVLRVRRGSDPEVYPFVTQLAGGRR